MIDTAARSFVLLLSFQNSRIAFCICLKWVKLQSETIQENLRCSCCSSVPWDWFGTVGQLGSAMPLGASYLVISWDARMLKRNTCCLADSADCRQCQSGLRHSLNVVELHSGQLWSNTRWNLQALNRMNLQVLTADSWQPVSFLILQHSLNQTSDPSELCAICRLLLEDDEVLEDMPSNRERGMSWKEGRRRIYI